MDDFKSVIDTANGILLLTEPKLKYNKPTTADQEHKITTKMLVNLQEFISVLVGSDDAFDDIIF